MKYIIMAGGQYREWQTPRHLLKINGEEIIARTIRLLRENGIEDISISSHDPRFLKFDVPVLGHKNQYLAKQYNDYVGHWCDAFYPTDEPTCYIMGDVFFSPEAMKKIVKTKTRDIELFGSMPPFAKNYTKNNIEAFALKVTNTDHLKRAIAKTKKLDDEGQFWRRALIWELWTVIKDAPLPKSDADTIKVGYTVINDYTCDIDHPYDIPELEKAVNGQA